MKRDTAKTVLSLDFDGAWETLIPMLSRILESAESLLSRSDEYHTTQVMTLLVAFRSLTETFDCKPSENTLLADRYNKIAVQMLRWFEHRIKT